LLLLGPKKIKKKKQQHPSCLPPSQKAQFGSLDEKAKADKLRKLSFFSALNFYMKLCTYQKKST
jgi:hypothetical protein